MLSQTASPPRPSAEPHERDIFAGRAGALIVAAAVVVITALHVVTLLRFPPVFVDEANLASQAWAVAHTGRITGALGTVTFEHFAGYWTFWPVVGTAIQALALRVAGPSLLALRAVSLLFGFFLLAALWVIGDRLIGRQGAWLTVILTSLSLPFFISAHLARQDIMVAALGFGAIALYVADRASSLTVWSVLSGLALGIAFEIHINAVIYGPVLVALYWLDFGWVTPRKGKFHGFALGVVAGLTFYVLMHIARYPHTFFAIGALAFAGTKAPPLLTMDPAVLLSAIQQSASQLVILENLRLALAFVGAGALLSTRAATDRKILAIPFVLMFDFVAVTPWQPGFYFILITPAIDLLSTALLAKLLSPRWLRTRRTAFALGALLGSALFTVGAVHVFGPSPMDDYSSAASRVQEIVPPNSSVMGAEIFWFALPNRRYLSYMELNYQRRYSGDGSLEDAFRHFHPDYFIMDAQVQSLIVDDHAGLEPWARLQALGKMELAAVLAKHGKLVANIPTRFYGNIRIYHLRWSTR